MNEPLIYGTAPVNLGLIDMHITEMLFWMYCPIKLRDTHHMVIPDNLRQFEPIVYAAMEEVGEERWRRDFVYLTAKNVYTTPDNTAQRPGWHCDGFMTDDLNYIWADKEPTLFWVPPALISLPQDHAESIAKMETITDAAPEFNRTYPLRHLLRLDQTVIHRVNDFSGSGMRAFVKLSVSRHPFNLVGNSINHKLAPDWHYEHRSAERNPEVARMNDMADPLPQPPA